MDNYSKLIVEEKLFWANYDVSNLKLGIPHWIDLQNAELLDEKRVGPWADPGIEDYYFGKQKRAIIDLCTKTGGKILELGCGSGWLCLELSRKNLDITGIDVSEKRLNIAANIANNNNAKVKYIAQDLNTPFILGEKYDVVIAWFSLHHILKIEDLLINIKKNLLKKKGIIITCEHQKNFLRNFVDFINIHFIKKEKKEISPFEGVHSSNLPILLKNYFNVSYQYSFHAFSKVIIEILYFFSIYRWLPKRVMYMMIQALNCTDNLFCDVFKIKGENIFTILKNE